MLSISVIIPTYHRTHGLRECLAGLELQSRKPNEVIIVIRDSDDETWNFCEQYLTAAPFSILYKLIKVTVPGQVAALNRGLEETTTDILCITDDDAVPHPQWIEKIENHFLEDPAIAGVGGRDWVYQNKILFQGSARIVGKVQWFGRIVGNHCFGEGAAREVDVLKGANMSYRRSAIEGISFNTNLWGSGAQVHNDLAFSLEVRKRSWRLIYDPEVSVDHFPAMRFDEDGRDVFSAAAFKNAAHNETLILLNYLKPIQRLAYLIWSFTIGTRGKPGLLQLIRFLPMSDFHVFQKWRAAQQGTWDGIVSTRKLSVQRR